LLLKKIAIAHPCQNDPSNSGNLPIALAEKCLYFAEQIEPEIADLPMRETQLYLIDAIVISIDSIV
jgi:hypothetical protein